MRRHFALRHRLGTEEAAKPATRAWVSERIHRYAEVGGVGAVAAYQVVERPTCRRGHVGRGQLVVR